MAYSKTGQLSAERAAVKIDLAIHLTEMLSQKMQNTLSQLLGPLLYFTGPMLRFTQFYFQITFTPAHEARSEVVNLT